MNKKSITIALAALIATTALAGCASTTPAKITTGQVTSKIVKTPAGNVACIFWVPVTNAGVADADGAQMSCDWSGAGK
ncbi:MAG: hypothetical protein ABIP33_06365 [Pseudolysinimonas sp.]